MNSTTVRHRKRRRRRRLNPRFVVLVSVILLVMTALIVKSFGQDDDSIILIAEPPVGTVAQREGDQTGDNELGLVPLVYVEEQIIEPQPEETKPEEPPYTEVEVTVLAKMLWGEARGVQSKTEQAAVIWCVLNRVDHPSYPDTIVGVVTQKSQFHGYDPSHPVDEELVMLVKDVLNRWYAEKDGVAVTGRVLPEEYIYFYGDGARNHFTSEWLSDDTWNWGYVSPYES